MSRHFTVSVLIYSLLSLTVIRILPMVVALWGSDLRFSSKLFLGWFGPRGLASIVFAVIVLNHEVPNGEFLAVVVVCTVRLSVLLHGATANPLARAIGRRTQGVGSEVG